MALRAHSPYEEPESSTLRWVALFVLLSLLAHAILIAAILLVTFFVPVPKIAVPAPAPTVSLSFLPPAAAPPRQNIFIPTTPQANVPHKPQLVQSANDTNLTSRSQTARDSNSIMPDIKGKPHAPDLNDSPEVQAQPKPEVSSTPPTPRVAQPEKPTPPQPNPQRAQKPPPHPTPPTPKPLPPTPTPKPQPQLDANGLPVLPPISAPTMAPPNSGARPLAPAPSERAQAEDSHGAIGLSGANSPAAMATELGKYKQYVHAAVGSVWYPDIDQHFGTIGVGMVHIQFTIHSDGRITDVVILEGEDLQILKDISRHALVAPAPYKAFSDAMIKEVGDSYTDDFTFSVYGN
jgi:outer membrane biosynthesis protein TonB